MKRIILASAALALIAGPALADNTLAFNLDGDVSEICGVYNFRGTALDIGFGDLATVETSVEVVRDQPGTNSYVCNAPGGFTRQITSANNGSLNRAGTQGGANNSIAYTISHQGVGGRGAFANKALTSAQTDTFPGDPSYLAGQSGRLTVRLNGVLQSAVGTVNGANRTTVFAGDYTDVITIALNGN